VVSSVEDAPTHAQLPQEVLVAVGDALTIELQIEDVDTSVNDLIIATDVSWAIIDSYNNLILAPTSVGSFEVKITISDGQNVVTESLIVLATSDPDLLIESVEIDGEEAGQIERGGVTSIKVFVRNEGLSAASLVTVRCYDGQTLINTSVPIPVIEPSGLGIATCVWLVPAEVGDVSLRVYVDPTYDILEVSETNNEYHSTIEVIYGENEGGGAGSEGGAAKAPSMSMVYVLAVVIGLGAIVVMQLGPGKIRREI
jgi:subtilase family serine protease